jgi:hypothetical protein
MNVGNANSVVNQSGPEGTRPSARGSIVEAFGHRITPEQGHAAISSPSQLANLRPGVFQSLPYPVQSSISRSIPPEDRGAFASVAKGVARNTRVELRAGRVSHRASQATTSQQFQALLGITEHGPDTIPKLPAELQHEPLHAAGVRVLELKDDDVKAEVIPLIYKRITTLINSGHPVTEELLQVKERLKATDHIVTYDEMLSAHTPNGAEQARDAFLNMIP